MDILNASDTDFRKKLQAITSRGEADTSKVEDAVKEIITGIRRHGDKALFSYTNRFDGLSIDKKTIRVSDAEFRNARKAVSKGIVESLKLAAKRIETFHSRQLEESWLFHEDPGEPLKLTVWPLERAPAY